MGSAELQTTRGTLIVPILYIAYAITPLLIDAPGASFYVIILTLPCLCLFRFVSSAMMWYESILDTVMIWNGMGNMSRCRGHVLWSQ
jgi:hypothetical protein